MCELIAQSTTPALYLERLGLASNASCRLDLEADEPLGETLHRACPDIHDRERVLKPNHRVGAIIHKDGHLKAIQVRWGWSPVWSMGTRPPLTHLPLEIVMRSKVFERMRNGGKALVAVDGWFDLAPDGLQKGHNRLVYKRRRKAGPIFLGALAQISDAPSGCSGLVLVTHGGGGAAGPLQLLAFDEESALQWLDPAVDWAEARELIAGSGHQDEALECVPLSRQLTCAGAY